jgi:hypothetical protein
MKPTCAINESFIIKIKEKKKKEKEMSLLGSPDSGH